MNDWLRCPEEKITMVTAGESSKQEASGKLAATAIISTSTGNGDSFWLKFTGSCTAAFLSLPTQGGGRLALSTFVTYKSGCETGVNLLSEY